MESLIAKIALTSATVSRPGRKAGGRKARAKITTMRPKPPRQKRGPSKPTGAREAIVEAMRGRTMTRAEVLDAIGADGSRFTFMQGWGEFLRMQNRGQIVGTPAPLPGRYMRKLFRLASDMARDLA